jgi:glutamate 5-kinase
LVQADLLILLSDIDGLYTADPKKEPTAVLIPQVDTITDDILALAGGAGSDLGSGGMATKLRAAKIAMDAGIDMIITNGENPEILYDIFDGKAVGTKFLGKSEVTV